MEDVDITGGGSITYLQWY